MLGMYILDQYMHIWEDERRNFDICKYCVIEMYLCLFVQGQEEQEPNVQ